MKELTPPEFQNSACGGVVLENCAPLIIRKTELGGWKSPVFMKNSKSNSNS